MAKVFNLTGGGGDGIRKRLEALEKTVGGSEAGLVKGVAENTADLTALRSDVSDVQRQQSAHDTAISANTAAAAAAKAAADSAASDASAAAQAAQAAQTAAGSASAAASDALAKANAALPLAGGTMTGAIISTDLILRSPDGSYDVLDFGDRSEGSYNSIKWSRSGDLVPAASTIILRSIKSPVLDSDAATKGYADSIGFNATIPRSAKNKVFYNASFSGEGYNFTNCLFISCTMQYNNMVFNNCTFINCIINFGVVDDGQTNSLKDCFLIGCNIISSYMSSVRFTSCKLTGCNVTNESIYWTSCTFNSCYFRNTSKAPSGVKPSINNYPDTVNKTSGGGVAGS